VLAVSVLIRPFQAVQLLAQDSYRAVTITLLVVVAVLLVRLLELRHKVV
jgi:hypothetical protein